MSFCIEVTAEIFPGIRTVEDLDVGPTYEAMNTRSMALAVQLLLSSLFRNTMADLKKAPEILRTTNENQL